MVFLERIHLSYLSWSKSSSLLERIGCVENEFDFVIGRGIFDFFEYIFSAFDDVVECSLAVVILVDDVAEDIRTGIRETDFFRWRFSKGFIDVAVVNGRIGSQELARRFGLLIKLCRLNVFDRSCCRKFGQFGSWYRWWVDSVDEWGRSFNDSHLHETQRGQRITGDDCWPWSNGSDQLRSVLAKSICSFDIDE